jgi:hypothetical protein
MTGDTETNPMRPFTIHQSFHQWIAIRKGNGNWPCVRGLWLERTKTHKALKNLELPNVQLLISKYSKNNTTCRTNTLHCQRIVEELATAPTKNH